MTCEDHPDEYIFTQNVTEAPLIPKCNTDLNVIILIGLLRWRLGMKRHEIRAFLVTKGIYLSTGTISNRSLDFLLLFKQLHKNKCEEIKALIERKGGMILHMDGTHRAGGRVAFVLQEGHDNIVIDADLIPSEAEEHVNPLLSEFKIKYGSPLVIVRDMAKGLALSSSKIFPDIPQQICQVHFIRNLEKDLITEYHKNLKSSIVKHKLTSKLKALRNCYSECGEDEVKKLQGLWVHIAVDYLLNPIVKRVKWISRPISYFIQYSRIKEVCDLVRRLVSCNASNNFIYKPLMELYACLRSVLDDSEVLHNYCILEKILQWLDELCDNLRITRKTNLKDSLPTGVDLDGVLTQIRKLLVEIRVEGRNLGGKYLRIASAISDAFTSHWDELFVPDPIIDGKKVPFRRHNNGLESSHRRIRKGIRERTGKSETNREMEQFGDLLAILSNLWNEVYLKEISYDMEDLGCSLSMYVKDLPGLRKEYREIRKGPTVPIADIRRIDVLESFVEVLESDNQSSELISILQSILGAEASAGAVC